MAVRVRKDVQGRPDVERRKNPRKHPSVIPHLKKVQLVAGPSVRLLNVSLRGAMLESEAGLAPGSQVALRIVTADAIVSIRGRVVYSRAIAFKGSNLQYHSAVEFESEFPLAEVQLEGEADATDSVELAVDPQVHAAASSLSGAKSDHRQVGEQESPCAHREAGTGAESESKDVTVH